MRPRDAGPPSALVAVVLAVLVAGGCFAHAEDRCKGCAIVDFQRPTPPAPRAGQRALVVLLHGAFGFGTEWDPIVAALRARPELAFWAFAWPGPFGGRMPNRAESFRAALQRAISALPDSAREVLVLAHSAGGAVADYAARRLQVPDGVRVTVALLDGSRLSVAPYTPVEPINTPLGLPLGATPSPTPPVPRNVTVGDYRASDPPGRSDAERNRARPTEIGVVAPTGETVYWLGRHVTHGGAVTLVSLPLIEKLAR